MPDTTQDCENDPNYDRDQVQNFFDQECKEGCACCNFLSGLCKTFPRGVQQRVWVHPSQLWWAQDCWRGGSRALPQHLHLQQHQNVRGGFTINVFYCVLSLFRFRPALQPVWRYLARLQRSFTVSLNWQKGTIQRGTLTRISCLKMLRLSIWWCHVCNLPLVFTYL